MNNAVMGIITGLLLTGVIGCSLAPPNLPEPTAGRDFPDNLTDYSLVIQCGGCMHNRREILSRVEKCNSAGVAITNYGLCISQTQGVLRRVLQPFPAALDAYERIMT